MIKKTLNLRNASLKEKISCLENKLNEHKENFEMLKKQKPLLKKKNKFCKRKKERLTFSFAKFSNG